MNVSVEVKKTSDIQRKIMIQVPAELVNDSLTQGYAEVQSRAKVKGFRPGKVPLQMIKEQYGADVEYKTTDVGKSELWDQKTLYYGHTGFDGRIHHTHTKNRDDGGKGVGLLFDSTFIRRKNYEKAWLQIHEAVLSGEISPDAVKETKASLRQDQALRALMAVSRSSLGCRPGTLRQHRS